MESEQCFIDLNSIDKPDWNNIPVPLIRALRTIKKCLVSLMYGIKENSDKIQEVNREATFQLQEFDSEIKSMRKSAISSEDTVKETLSELTEKLTQSTTSFRSFLNSEFEGMKKNYDSKLLNSDQQLRNFTNALKSLPKYDEIERMIKESLRENNAKFEVHLKDDIKISMIDPESRKTSDKFDLVEMFKEEIKQKMVQQAEDCSKMIKSLNYETDEKLQKLKKFQENLGKNLEKLQEDSDFSIQEILGKTDFLNKNITEKITLVSFNLTEASEKTLKSVNEVKAGVTQLAQDLEALKASIPPPSPTFERQLTVEVPESPSMPITEIHKVRKSRKKKESSTGLKEEILKLKDELIEKSNKNEDFLDKSIKKISTEVENTINSLRKEMYDSVFEVREKLHWLPVNISQIKGMPPNEARVFILEARLRAEENARNEQINKVMNALDILKNELRSNSENAIYGGTLPSIGSMTFEGKANGEVKEYTRRMANWVRDLPTPEKIRLKFQNTPKVCVSVDLNKSKQRRLST